MTTLVSAPRATLARPRADGAVDRGARLDRRRLVLLDPGLFFEGGHHATLARLVRDEAERRGIEPVIFGARRINRPPTGLMIRRHFRTSPYAGLSRSSPADDLRVYNGEVLEDARSLPTELLDGATVLAPTLTSRIALGVARWASELPADVDVRVAVMFMFQPGWGGDERLRTAELAIYREAAALLSQSSRVTMFAETRPIGAMFERLGASSVRTLPWPVSLPAPETPPLPYDALRTPPHVTHLGYTKLERGFALLPDVVERVRSARPDVRFTIQANYWDPTAFADADARLSGMGGAVRLLRGALEPGPFAESLRETDIALLSYNPTNYRDRGSGVFAEAASLGKAVIVPAGTWMAQHAEEHGLAAVAFDRFDAESVAAAVVEAAERRRELLEQAARAARAWNELRSPRAFVDAVLEGDPAAERSPEVVRVRGNGAHAHEMASVDAPAPKRTAVDPEHDAEFLADGMWTPQTAMLRAVRDWVLASEDEPRSALSIDRNPTLTAILKRRWPALAIEEARHPEHDVQDLSLFADETFDLTFSHQVLEHVPRPWVAAAELVRVTRPGGLGIHTTCAANPRHGPPAFNDYYRFLPDGLEALFGGVDVVVKAGWGNRQALAYNLAIDDGHGALGGRRFCRAIGEANEENFPWHTWIIYRAR